MMTLTRMDLAALARTTDRHQIVFNRAEVPPATCGISKRASSVPQTIRTLHDSNPCADGESLWSWSACSSVSLYISALSIARLDQARLITTHGCFAIDYGGQCLGARPAITCATVEVIYDRYSMSLDSISYVVIMAR